MAFVSTAIDALGGTGTAILGSSIIGALGSNSAAQTQSAGQQQAAQTQQNMFNTVQANSQPFMQAGYGATTSLQNLMGIGSSTTGGAPGGTDPSTGLPNGYLAQTFNPTQAQLNQYPGYQFALQTGDQAIQNQSTPGAGALSGQTLKSLMNFNQQTANSNYQNYFNQFQTQQSNVYNRLAAIAGLGQNAAAGVGNNGATIGSGIASAQAAAGTSAAAGTVGATNAISGGMNTLAGLMYLNNTNQTPQYVPPIVQGSNPNGYQGTMNNPSAYVGGAPGG